MYCLFVENFQKAFMEVEYHEPSFQHNPKLKKDQ